MAERVTVTVELDKQLWDRLAKLGGELHKDEGDLAVEAIEAYVQDEEDILAAIDEGLADAEAGRVVPHEEVARWLDSWGKPNELPPPKCK